MKITIYGNPIGKARPRFMRRGGHVGTYNPKETEEGMFAVHAKAAWGDRPIIEGPVIVRATYYFARPKSHFGTGRNSEILKPSAPADVLKKPDLDNLVKFSWDCLNGICFVDDCQVVKSSEEKLWADDGLARTEIVVLAK